MGPKDHGWYKVDGAPPEARHPSTMVQFRCQDSACDARWWQGYECVAVHEEQHDCPNCHQPGKVSGYRWSRDEAAQYDEIHGDRED